MSRPTSRRAWRIALVLASLSGGALGPSARADTLPPPLSSSLTGNAKASYDAGKLLYEDKDYASAAIKFRAAFTASRDPRLLWNVASCEKELRHYARASILVERFLKDAALVVPPEFVAQAQATLAALRQLYGPVHLSLEPTGTKVTIDGEDVGTAPFQNPVPVDFGAHTLKAEHQGYEPYETTFDVKTQSVTNVSGALKVQSYVARLAIQDSPGDSVVVDDLLVAVGPWEGTLTPGRHHVVVSASGKQSFDEQIEVGLGERRELHIALRRGGGLGPWPWIVGSVVVAGGLAVGGYFLLK